MTSKAREIFELNEYDNMTLTVKNLERVAKQRDQNYEKEETAYIFEDGSAIIDCGNDDYRIEDNYGLSVDYEQL